MHCLGQTARLRRLSLDTRSAIKEYKALEKKYNALIKRLSHISAQIYASSKSLKGIDRKKTVKGYYCHSSFQGKTIQKRNNNKTCVGTPIIHKSDYTMLPEGSVIILSS